MILSTGCARRSDVEILQIAHDMLLCYGTEGGDAALLFINAEMDRLGPVHFDDLGPLWIALIMISKCLASEIMVRQRIAGVPGDLHDEHAVICEAINRAVSVARRHYDENPGPP